MRWAAPAMVACILSGCLVGPSADESPSPFTPPSLPFAGTVTYALEDGSATLTYAIERGDVLTPLLERVPGIGVHVRQDPPPEGRGITGQFPVTTFAFDACGVGVGVEAGDLDDNSRWLTRTPGGGTLVPPFILLSGREVAPFREQHAVPGPDDGLHLSFGTSKIVAAATGPGQVLVWQEDVSGVLWGRMLLTYDASPFPARIEIQGSAPRTLVRETVEIDKRPAHICPLGDPYAQNTDLARLPVGNLATRTDPPVNVSLQMAIQAALATEDVQAFRAANQEAVIESWRFYDFETVVLGAEWRLRFAQSGVAERLDAACGPVHTDAANVQEAYVCNTTVVDLDEPADPPANGSVVDYGFFVEATRDLLGRLPTSLEYTLGSASLTVYPPPEALPGVRLYAGHLEYDPQAGTLVRADGVPAGTLWEPSGNASGSPAP